MALVKLGVTPLGNPSTRIITVGLCGMVTRDLTAMLTLAVSPAGRASQPGEALTLNFWSEAITWNFDNQRNMLCGKIKIMPVIEFFDIVVVMFLTERLSMVSGYYD